MSATCGSCDSYTSVREQLQAEHATADTRHRAAMVPEMLRLTQMMLEHARAHLDELIDREVGR